MTIEEVVRLVLRLWLAGAMDIGLLLGRVGPFLIAAIGLGGWIVAHRTAACVSPEVRAEQLNSSRFLLR